MMVITIKLRFVIDGLNETDMPQLRNLVTIRTVPEPVEQKICYNTELKRKLPWTKLKTAWLH